MKITTKIDKQLEKLAKVGIKPYRITLVQNSHIEILDHKDTKIVKDKNKSFYTKFIYCYKGIPITLVPSGSETGNRLFFEVKI